MSETICRECKHARKREGVVYPRFTCSSVGCPAYNCAVDDEFGCVLFQPKLVPTIKDAHRLGATARCGSAIIHDLNADLSAGRLTVTPIFGYTHIAALDGDTWLVRIEEVTP